VAKQTPRRSRPAGRAVTHNVIELELQRLQTILRYARVIEWREKAAVGYLEEKGIKVGGEKYRSFCNQVDLEKWNIAVMNSLGSPYRFADLDSIKRAKGKTDKGHIIDAGIIGAVQIVEISKAFQGLFVRFVDSNRSLHFADALEIGGALAAIEKAFITLDIRDFMGRERIKAKAEHQAAARRRHGEKNLDAVTEVVSSILAGPDWREYIWWTPVKHRTLKRKKISKEIAKKLPSLKLSTIERHVSRLPATEDLLRKSIARIGQLSG